MILFVNVWLFLLYIITISACTILYEGDLCTVQKTGLQGKCTLIGNCNSAREELARREKPQICGFVGLDPIVCCTQARSNNELYVKRKTVGEISLQKCEEYSKLIYPNKVNEFCPMINEEDADYRVAAPKEFPHTALIGRDSILGKSWECPAVLISENYILTTRFCLYFGIDGYVRLGANLNATTKYGGNIQIRNLTELIPFPEYLSRNTDNNIALAKLSSPVEFNEFVHPACVNTEKSLGNRFFTSDWEFYFDESEDGNNKYGSTRDIRKVTLEIISSDNCTEKYKEITTTSEAYICAALVSTSYKYQCTPRGFLMATHPKAFCMQSVVGLEAFSLRSCNAQIQPIAYTNVYNYIDWIEKNVWDKMP